MRSGLGMVGPLMAFAPGFSAELVARGYRPRSAAAQMALMADVSRWLADHGLDERDLSEARVDELMAHRRVSGPATLLSSRAMVPLLEYLRSVGAAPLAVTVPAATAAEELVERYATYLSDRRGLARSTVRNYVWVARVFLDWREATAGALELERLDAAAVSEFVLEQAAQSCVGTAKCMVTRLRVLLRFLHVEGEIEHTLADAVPSVAGWRLAGLIKALDSRSVARLLAGCDRRTRVGRRDFAIVVLLSRLGLRAGRSPRCSLSTSTGGPARSWSAARAAATNACRCPLMSVTHSRAGWSAGDRAATRRLCSRACVRRISASHPVPSRSSCAASRPGRGWRRWALTGSGIRPRPRCFARAGA